MKLLPASVLILLALFSTPALAWHEEGHETVAAIAWDQMTPEARTKAAALLASAPASSEIAALRPTSGTAAERDRLQFIRVAIWSDKVRVGPRARLYHKGIWHYTDYFWEQQTPDGAKRQRPDVPPHGDLVTKLPALEASLRHPQGPAVSPSKGTDLAWFIHLMGDIAQPLHCSGRITALDQKGDQGGNFFCLTTRHHLEGEGEGECRNNLHAYWDHVIEREFGGTANIVQVAATIESRNPRTPFTRLSLGQYEAWARTSQRIAMQVAYPATLTRGVTPSPQYRDVVSRVSQKAIALGGYRLGATLNSILAP